MTRPVHGAQVLRRTLPKLIGTDDRTVRPGQVVPVATSAPLRFGGLLPPDRVVVARSLELAALRRARRSVAGASVNDVVLSIVGGALRHHLGAELDGSPLVAVVPLSVRRKGERGTGGNQVTTLSIPLGTDHADPVDRLAAVADATRRARETATAVGARDLVDYSEAMPGALVALAARAASLLATTPGTSPHACVVTNVPGPRSPIYLAGARLVSMYGLTPSADGLALTHTVVTYCATVAISVVSTPATLPDPQGYGDALEHSAGELVAAAGRG